MCTKCKMEDIQVQWLELEADYKKLEENHQEYLKVLKKVTTQQEDCLKQIVHQRYRLRSLQKSLKSVKKVEEPSQFQEDFAKREAQLQLIEDTLPREGGVYLKLVAGNINYGFLSESAKFKYKGAYEKFKLVCLMIATSFLILNMSVSSVILQECYLFYLVWYYSTLTVRESILRANGSKIKTWWRLHHALSIAASVILLVWPENACWEEFKPPFYRYSLYTCLVQFLQFNYQSGALYRLRTLGKKDNMEITIEGFQHWMWRGLAFLYPFLFAAYIYQLVLAYKLTQMWMYHPEATWHILVTSCLMATFFLGNMITVLMVIPNKIKNRMVVRYKLMATKLYDAAAPKRGFKKDD